MYCINSKPNFKLIKYIIDNERLTKLMNDTQRKQYDKMKVKIYKDWTNEEYDMITYPLRYKYNYKVKYINKVNYIIDKDLKNGTIIDWNTIHNNQIFLGIVVGSNIRQYKYIAVLYYTDYYKDFWLDIFIYNVIRMKWNFIIPTRYIIKMRTQHYTIFNPLLELKDIDKHNIQGIDEYKYEYELCRVALYLIYLACEWANVHLSFVILYQVLPLSKEEFMNHSLVQLIKRYIVHFPCRMNDICAIYFSYGLLLKEFQKQQSIIFINGKERRCKEIPFDFLDDVNNGIESIDNWIRNERERYILSYIDKKVSQL